MYKMGKELVVMDVIIITLTNTIFKKIKMNQLILMR